MQKLDDCVALNAVMAHAFAFNSPARITKVIARGNRREAVFLDDDDRRFFLKALGEACERTGWRQTSNQARVRRCLAFFAEREQPQIICVAAQLLRKHHDKRR